MGSAPSVNRLTMPHSLPSSTDVQWRYAHSLAQAALSEGWPPSALRLTPDDPGFSSLLGVPDVVDVDGGAPGEGEEEDGDA